MIDLAGAEEVFAASIDCTVGLEEEFAVLDASSLDLVPRFEELRDLAAAEDPVLSEAIAGELISSEIEIRSGRGEDVQHAIQLQREARRRLFALADDLVDAGVKIIFNYSEALVQVPPEVTVHTSSPAVDLLYALYFYLT